MQRNFLWNITRFPSSRGNHDILFYIPSFWSWTYFGEVTPLWGWGKNIRRKIRNTMSANICANCVVYLSPGDGRMFYRGNITKVLLCAWHPQNMHILSTIYNSWFHDLGDFVYHGKTHERGSLTLLCLCTNGHRSAALARQRFILPSVFVQAAVIKSWWDMIRLVCSFIRSINSLHNRLILHH